MLGASFPFKMQEKGLHKEFRGGGGSWGPQNSLCRISSRAFFALEESSWRKTVRNLGKSLIGVAGLKKYHFKTGAERMKGA